MKKSNQENMCIYKSSIFLRRDTISFCSRDLNQSLIRIFVITSSQVAMSGRPRFVKLFAIPYISGVKNNIKKNNCFAN